MALIQSFSGIRGIYGKDLTERAAIKYAYAYITFVKGKTKKNNLTLVMGTDTRPSGLKLSDSILEIIDCNFIDVGILPTPAIEFAVRYFNADGGIIITASHNEPYWNGFKFLGNDGAVLNEKNMNSVISNFRMLKNFHKIQERGVVEKNSEALKKYNEFLFEIMGSRKIEMIKNSRQKIIIDPNGGAGIAAKKILEHAGVEVIGINMNYGDFVRKVEPTEDSLVYLKSIINQNKAEFAAGFDCDADRVEILMEDGSLLSGNYILALVVEEMLSSSRNPRNEIVVVNDATSNIVRHVVQKHSAKLKEVEVGETIVVEEMRKSKAVIGGEGSSGGVIIPPSKCRDGILTLLMLLSIIAKKQKKLNDIVAELPKFYYLMQKIEFNAKNHDKLKKSIKNYYSKKGFEIKETGGIKGGLKILTSKNSFAWFRASKTESNVMRIISDSDNENESKKIMKEAVEVFDKANESN